MILHSQNLVNTLRHKCDTAQHRIWIASPFIGSINEVKKIIGGSWMKTSIDFKVLTDIDAGFIKKDTYKEFKQYAADIRSLKSLHAKIYIIDDCCLLTSANLTGTAFSRRYEIGTIINDSNDFKDIELLFTTLWNKATIVRAVKAITHSSQHEYEDGVLFSKHCNLPPYTKAHYLSDQYEDNCKLYNDFAKDYQKITGRNQEMVNDGYSLLQEIDYFLNYLYHDHEDTPSLNVNILQILSATQKEKQLKKYFSDLCRYYPEHKQVWRLERTELVQKYLAPNAIRILDWDKVKEVTKCLHCLSSYPLNRSKFWDSKNNSLNSIIDSWELLLHTGDVTYPKIEKVVNSLKFFGLSSAQELVGWYYPDKYPIINGNSNCGMRFLGYNVR
jgi:uncharacterized protein YerC